MHVLYFRLGFDLYVCAVLDWFVVGVGLVLGWVWVTWDFWLHFGLDCVRFPYLFC